MTTIIPMPLGGFIEGPGLERWLERITAAVAVVDAARIVVDECLDGIAHGPLSQLALAIENLDALMEPEPEDK